MFGAGASGDALFAMMTPFSMAATIGLARYYGFSFVFPLFTWMEIRGAMRFAVAAGLSLPSMVMVYQVVRNGGQPSPAIWAALVVKEAFVGALLGGLLGLPFWGIQGVGDALDVYRGASAANLFDPIHAQEMTISGKFLMMMALALFAILGGVGESVDLLLHSQNVWPIMHLAPPFDVAALKGFGAVVLKALTIALVLGAPLFIALLLVDVTLIFAVRGARAFNVYDLAHSARGLLLLFILPVYVILFAHHFETYLRDVLSGLRRTIAALTG